MPYGTPVSSPMNTASTNDLSGDGYTWPDAHTLLVDKFGKLIMAVQRNGGGSHTNNFVWSNNQGTSWTDGAGAYSFLNRASLAYDAVNDILHALWVGIDMTTGEGFIYRRYLFTRDGSNNITAITHDGSTNLQIDFDTTGAGSSTMAGDFPHLAWLQDAAYGTYGALLALWSVDQTGSTGGRVAGYEYRASMCILGATATRGATAANWVSLTGTPDTTSLGTGSVPAVAYTRLAGRTGAANALVGSFGYLRKAANAHASDLYLFYFDINSGTSGGQWAYRRLQWAPGTNNWANGLTAQQTLSVNTIAGTDTGYALKYQLATQVAEETVHDEVFFGGPTWQSNVLGDSQNYWKIPASDTPSATVSLNSQSPPADIYAPTQDLMIDQVTSLLICTWDTNGAVDQNYGIFQVIDGHAGTLLSAAAPINTVHGCDIPLLLATRYNNAIVGAFRYTLNTPTPPYTGLFYQIPITAAAVGGGSLSLLGVGH